MNINTVKNNISAFIFVILLFGSALGSSFIYVFLEYKSLQKEKILFQTTKQKTELNFLKEKHNLELQIKNFEILKINYNSDSELTQANVINNENLKTAECREELQKYKYQSITVLKTKEIEIQNLHKKVNEQNNKIENLYVNLEKSKAKNLLLKKSIKKMNGADKISQLISEYAKKYSSISKDDYIKYSDYIEASRQFEAIQGLVNVYHLENEYNDFIRLVSKRLYVYER